MTLAVSQKDQKLAPTGSSGHSAHETPSLSALRSSEKSASTRSDAAKVRFVSFVARAWGCPEFPWQVGAGDHGPATYRMTLQASCRSALAEGIPAAQMRFPGALRRHFKQEHL